MTIYSTAYMNSSWVVWIYIAVIFLLRMFLFAISLAIYLGLIYVVHLLFSLPMRRAERARLFLDLLVGALNCGQSAN